MNEEFMKQRPIKPQKSLMDIRRELVHKITQLQQTNPR